MTPLIILFVATFPIVVNTQPGQIALMMFFLLLFLFVIRHNMTLAELVLALNSAGSQPTAIVVLIIGCVMLKICKDAGLDPTVAGTIIGVAGNMLTNQFAKQHTETKTDSSGNETKEVKTDSSIPKE